MKQILTVLLAVLTIAALGSIKQSNAQNPDVTPLQESFVGSHNSCTVSAGVTRECKAADGVWVSENGAAYYKLGPSSTVGVTSLNGKTGDLKITAVAAAPTATTTTTAPSVTVSVN